MKDYIRGQIFAKGLRSYVQKTNDTEFGVQHFESRPLGSLSPLRDFGSWLQLKIPSLEFHLSCNIVVPILMQQL